MGINSNNPKLPTFMDGEAAGVFVTQEVEITLDPTFSKHEHDADIRELQNAMEKKLCTTEIKFIWREVHE